MRTHTELPTASDSHEAAAFDACAIDWQTIIDDLDGDEALLRELIEVFLATYPGTLNEARAGLEQGDLPAVARVAHKLKGTVGNFGFGPAWKTSRALEETARGAKLIESRAAFKAAEREFARLEERLLSRIRTASA